MQYKVVPFVANVSNTQGASAAASQLENLIASHTADGWEYMRLENVETSIAGSSGCFGIGATPGMNTSYSMVIFRK